MGGYHFLLEREQKVAMGKVGSRRRAQSPVVKAATELEISSHNCLHLFYLNLSKTISILGLSHRSSKQNLALSSNLSLPLLSSEPVFPQLLEKIPSP